MKLTLVLLFLVAFAAFKLQPKAHASSSLPSRLLGSFDPPDQDCRVWEFRASGTVFVSVICDAPKSASFR